METNSPREEIDEIMEEMEAHTPKSAESHKTFSEFEVHQNADSTDAKGFNSSGFFSSILNKPPPASPSKPGHVYGSRPTMDRYYDVTHTNVGVALIFNQLIFTGEQPRKGSEKDARDLEQVLIGMGFATEVHTDFTTRQIRECLQRVAQLDHSDNDCLLITIMTHGKQDGRIYSRDGEFMANDLWKNFLGDNCKTLIGKPKLFFIQACRGTMTDPGAMLHHKPKLIPMPLRSDAVDSRVERKPNETFVIPTLADVLIMYSAAEGFYSFRNPVNGSWFIQALCKEFRENSHEELMTILTNVNREVAYAKQADTPNDPDFDATKQMPVIQSMLTKSLYFLKKNQKVGMMTSV